MNIDHIVLWVTDQRRSLSFYEEVMGLPPVRGEEFAHGEVPPRGPGCPRRMACPKVRGPGCGILLQDGCGRPQQPSC